MKDDISTQMPEAGMSPNEFERDMPGTEARTLAEGAIEDLRRRGGVFVDAVRATRMPMVLTDPNLPGNPIVYANESFLKLSGYRMEDVLGQHPHFMNGPGTDPKDAARFMEMLRSDQDEIQETVQYRKDGSAFIATVLLSAFKDEDGRTLNHFMSWLDVTRRVDAESEVAELKETQAALRESEGRLRNVLDAMGEGFALFAPDFTILDVNAETLRLDGRTRDELVGRSHWEAFPGTEDSSLGAMYKRVMRDRVPEALEHPYSWPDGKTMWIEARAYPTTHGRIACQWRDISERRRADERLRDSEERYRTLFESMDEGYLLGEVLFNDNDEAIDIRFVEANSAAERLAGRDFTGRRMREIDPDYEEYWYEAYGRVALTGESVRAERYVEPHGRWFDYRLSRVGPPESRRVASVFQDITERRQAEAALRKSEEQLRLIVENAEDYAIFTTDPSGKVVDWRRGAELVFGYSAEEMTGQDCDRLFTPEDRANGQPETERSTAAQQGKAIDVRWHLRKDGTRVFIDGVSTALRDADGRLIGFLKIGQDVTERHRASQMQATLLAELQHRVRNILAMIRSIARRTGETTETMQDYVQHLEGRIGAMARTQSLLTRDVASTVDLQNLLLDELETQAAQPDQYRLTGPDVSLPGKAAEVLGLALHELATNSVKYGAMSSQDGRIDVRWALLEGDPNPQLSLIWSEFGVEIDDGPRRYGFGTELITERVPYELHGTGTLEFQPDGIVATVEFPLAEMPSILQTNEGVP